MGNFERLARKLHYNLVKSFIFINVKIDKIILLLLGGNGFMLKKA